jgi:hypothetical protein
MTKVDFGSAENLVRIGLLLTFVAMTFLTGTAFGEVVKMFFWMALIILFLETFKLPSVSAVNAAVAELIMTITMAVAGARGLFSSLGKTFTEYHIFLIVFIIGTLIMLYGSYKKLFSAANTR